MGFKITRLVVFLHFSHWVSVGKSCCFCCFRHFLLEFHIKFDVTQSAITYSKLIKTPERRHWYRSSVFIDNSEHISHLVLVLSSLILSRKMPAWIYWYELFPRVTIIPTSTKLNFINKWKKCHWLKHPFFMNLGHKSQKYLT